MFEHGTTLRLQFIFLELGVPVWPDRHRRRPWQEVDPVIAGTSRRQIGGRGEDVVEGVEQLVEQGRLVVVDGVQPSRLDVVASRADAAPEDAALLVLEGHAQVVEVP